MAVKLLVVEDNEMVREVMVPHLETDPRVHLIGAVGSAEQAHRHLLLEIPDVVILDLSLSDVPGDELCRQIRSRHPQIHCVFFSGRGDEEMRIKAIESGATAYLAKDSRMTVLIDLIIDVASRPPPPVLPP